jgi:hypothetical protein
MERLGAIIKSLQNNWTQNKVLDPVSPSYDEMLTTLPGHSVLKQFAEDEIRL